MNIKAIIQALLIIITSQVYGQSYYFRHYQVENGLSNNAVICSLQDEKGFLWFGTKDGLNRFDGYTFKVYRNNRNDPKSIGNNFIHNIYEDKSGLLWIGTDNGLYRYNATTENFNLLKGTYNNPVRDITMDGNGTLWFISGFTLFKYTARGSLKSYDVDHYFQATSICSSGDGTLWASTNGGLLEKYNSSTNSFTSFDMFERSEKTTARWIEKIYAFSKYLLIGTGTQGAKIFDCNTSTYRALVLDNSNSTGLFVRNFLLASDGEIWIATESGVFIYNLSKNQSINLQKNIMTLILFQIMLSIHFVKTKKEAFGHVLISVA